MVECSQLSNKGVRLHIAHENVFELKIKQD